MRQRRVSNRIALTRSSATESGSCSNAGIGGVVDRLFAALLTDRKVGEYALQKPPVLQKGVLKLPLLHPISAGVVFEVRGMWIIFFVLSIMVAIFFYWLRGRNRILYGAFELVVAVLLLLLIFAPHPDVLTAGNSGPEWFFPLSKVVSFFAAIYAFVHGWDNILA
jgi:hypothetical protein